MHASLPFRRSARRPWLLGLVLLAAVVMLPGLGSHVVRREQELRVLLTARDMVQTGRWLVPHYRGEPRLRKPPLMYWLVGALYKLGAPVDDPAWGRLPSALAGIGFVASLYLMGRRLIGPRRAHAAALAALGSVIVLRQARLASGDMMLTLFTTVAALAGALALRGARPAWWLAAWGAAGLGFLIKGPAAVALPLLAWLSLLIWRPGRVVSPLRGRPFWAGLLLFLLLTVPWYAYLALQIRPVADRQLDAELSALLVQSAHAEPFYYSAYTTLGALAPWGLLLPVALWTVARLRRAPAGWAFPLAWFITSFLVLSLLSSKQLHYALLLAGPGCLLVGCVLGARRGVLRRWGARAEVSGRVLVLAVGLALLFALLLAVRPVPVAPVLAVAAVVLLALTWPRWPQRFHQPAAALAITIALLLPGLERLGAMDGMQGTAARLEARMVEEHAGDTSVVVCVGTLDTSSAFYANRPVRYVKSLAEAWRIPEARVVLATWARRRMPEFRSLPARPALVLQDLTGGAAVFCRPKGGWCIGLGPRVRRAEAPAAG